MLLSDIISLEHGARGSPSLLHPSLNALYRQTNNPTKHMPGYPKVHLGDKAKEPRPGIPLALSKDKIAAGLTRTYGNLSRVADSIGCTRQALRRYIESDKELQETLRDARERTGDLLEDTAVNQALSGNGQMTQFLLKCRYRDRGYTFERDNPVDNTLQAAIALIMNRSKSPVDAL